MPDRTGFNPYDYKSISKDTDAYFLSSHQRKKVVKSELNGDMGNILTKFVNGIDRIMKDAMPNGDERDIKEFAHENEIGYKNCLVISRFCSGYSDIEELCRNPNIKYILRHANPLNLKKIIMRYHIRTIDDFINLISLPYFEHLKKLLKNSSTSSFSKDLNGLIESENRITVPTGRIVFDPHLGVDTCPETDLDNHGILSGFYTSHNLVSIFRYKNTIIGYQKLVGRPSFLVLCDVYGEDGILLFKKGFLYAIGRPIGNIQKDIDIDITPISINPIRMITINNLDRLIPTFFRTYGSHIL